MRYKVVTIFTTDFKEYNEYKTYFNTLNQTKHYLDSLLDNKEFYHGSVFINDELIYSMNTNGSISLGFD